MKRHPDRTRGALTEDRFHFLLFFYSHLCPSCRQFKFSECPFWFRDRSSHCSSTDKFICCLDNEKGHKNRFKRINFYIPKHKIVSCVNLNRQFFVIFSLPDSQDVIEEDLRGVP